MFGFVFLINFSVKNCKNKNGFILWKVMKLVNMFRFRRVLIKNYKKWKKMKPYNFNLPHWKITVKPSSGRYTSGIDSVEHKTVYLPGNFISVLSVISKGSNRELIFGPKWRPFAVIFMANKYCRYKQVLDFRVQLT